MKKRIYQIDYIKVVASFFVTAVHFRNRVEPLFEPEMITNGTKFFFSLNYSLFIIAVPLFIIATGYLGGKIEYGKKLYISLLNVYLKYFIIAQLSYQVMVMVGIRNQLSIQKLIFKTMNFTLISGWYVELYITLMFLAPLLSKIMSRFEKKEVEQGIFFLLISVSLPSFINQLPILKKYIYLPNYWLNFYPAIYFLIGSYFRKYGKPPVIKKKHLYYICLSIIIFTTALLFISARPYTYAADGYYQSITQVIFSSSIFLLLLDSKKLRKSKLVSHLSKHTLTIYIFSLPVDRILYHKFEIFLGSPKAMILFSPLIVLSAYFTVVVISLIFDKIYILLKSKITILALKTKNYNIK